VFVTLRQRNFAFLWFGGLISETGDWLLVIGLPIYLYLLTRSSLQTSALFMIELLPTILLGSVAGVFVDRWDRRRTLVVGNALQGVILLSLFAVRSPADLWIIYAVAVAESIISQFMGPAVNALLPNLVGEEHIVSANSLVSVNNNLARLVGSPLGGLVVGLWSLTGVVLLDSASFFLAMAVIAGVSTPGNSVPVGEEPNSLSLWRAVWRDWFEGLALVWRNQTISRLFCIGALQAASQGVFLVLYVIWVLKVLHGGATGVGWLRGVQAIGGLLGGILVGSIGTRVRASSLISVGSLGFGLVELAIWNSPSLVPGLALPTVLFVVVGLPGAAYGAGLNIMLQTSTVDQYRGRIFGAFAASYSVLMVGGMGLAGVLGDRVGVLPILNAQAGIYILTGLLALVLFRTHAESEGMLGREAER
jgi:hypothetical protein